MHFFHLGYLLIKINLKVFQADIFGTDQRWMHQQFFNTGTLNMISTISLGKYSNVRMCIP